jgi:hypothetical protein
LKSQFKSDEEKEILCEILIRAGADLNAANKSGQTPKHFHLIKSLIIKKPELVQ